MVGNTLFVHAGLQPHLTADAFGPSPPASEGAATTGSLLQEKPMTGGAAGGRIAAAGTLAEVAA